MLSAYDASLRERHRQYLEDLAKGAEADACEGGRAPSSSIAWRLGSGEKFSMFKEFDCRDDRPFLTAVQANVEEFYPNGYNHDGYISQRTANWAVKEMLAHAQPCPAFKEVRPDFKPIPQNRAETANFLSPPIPSFATATTACTRA